MPAEVVPEEIRLLRRIERWTREAALPLVRERVERLLDTDAKRRAYGAMNGTASLMAIEKATGANHTDVKGWLALWEIEGIVEPDASPPMASFTLRELGIAPPPPKAARPRKANAG
jgi:hypothetical protein